MLARVAISALILALTGCAMYRRADDAAAARTQMIGYTSEQVMICMGPPKKRGHQGAVEVWQYLSTSGYHAGTYGGYRYGSVLSSSIAGGGSSGDKSFCTVDVVIENDKVVAVNYSGPTSSSLFADDEQCGYAVRNCVHAGYGNSGR